jgi:repressor LexA
MQPSDAEQRRDVFSLLQAAMTESGVLPSAPVFEAMLAARKAGVRAPRRSARRRFSTLPILSCIPAGLGDPVEPVSDGSLPVDLEALNIKTSSRTFALKVRGDSMIGAQISDGDLVVIETREAKPGDIVAALIDGETTLKRLVLEDGKLFLRAENPRYADLIPVHDLTIQGVMRAVVRVCDATRRR